MKILITDIFIRKAFDVINVIQRNHHKDDLILANSVRKNWKSKILYGLKTEMLRTETYDYFESDLTDIQKLYPDDVFIYVPLEENTTVLFYEYIRKNPAHRFKYLLPDKEQFEIARNKEDLRKFCELNGISVPKQYTKEEIHFNNDHFTKLIVKPKEGSGSKGIFYIDSKEELCKLKDVDFSENLVQRQISNSNEVYGAFYLMQNGEVVVSYGHKRIRTYPLRGGVTVYSRLCFNDEVLDQGAKLLKKLNWTGFAMVEFLYDEIDQDYKVIEINPRLWGSIMLSEFCGANFIGNYISIIGGGQIQTTLNREEKYIRWFFPFDILNFIKSKGKIKSFWNLRDRRCCYINFTYASNFKALIYIVLGILNYDNIKKLRNKLFSKQ